MAFRIGIDVGGTFTDFLLMGPGGRSAAHEYIVHGTTITTNAVLTSGMAHRGSLI